VARKRRDTTAGIFHVFTHSVWAADALYRDDSDRMRFLRELALATDKTSSRCLAYCLMGTHYHLLLDVDAEVLARGMHSLNFRYAVGFNRRHAMKGHVHGTRYNAFRVNGEADLLSRYKYVARNPVEAGLCESPEDWRWSSYAATIGLAMPQPFVPNELILGCLDGPREIAIGRLRQYVAKS
jgi:REP element-mobilizing transposase RayT